MKTIKEFFEYELNGKKIMFHRTSKITVQLGKGKSSYKTQMSFTSEEFGKAVYYYNALNVGKGYKKRLYCESLNKKTLHKVLT